MPARPPDVRGSVPDAVGDRTQEPRHLRHLNRLRGRTEGFRLVELRPKGRGPVLTRQRSLYTIRAKAGGKR
jgi:hypothetical protein